MSADKKQQIMRAAERLFFTRRFHEITTDAIAKEAAVGKGTIYRYFENKDDLFYQTAMHGFEELCNLLEQDSMAVLEASLEQQLVRACEQIGGFFASRFRLFRLMQAEENHLALSRSRLKEHWRERRQRLIDLLAAILTANLPAQGLRVEFSVTELASFLLGLIRSRVHSIGGNESEPLSYNQLVDFFLYGCLHQEALRENNNCGIQGRI